MRAWPLVLLAVGSLQMVGDLAGLRALKALGAATSASPAPRVFSAVGELETFSTRFVVEWTDATGRRELALTPEVGARLRGPYQRRNVYGAALAYGPVLAADPDGRRLLAAVLGHALGGDAPLLRELGVDTEGVRDVAVRYVTRPGAALVRLPARLEVPLR